MEQEAGFAHPSYFEFLFGMGMVVFAEASVRIIQSLETGLGGRLDATNAVENPADDGHHIDQSRPYSNILAVPYRENCGRKSRDHQTRMCRLVLDGSRPGSVRSDSADRQRQKDAACREITKHAFKIQ